MPNTDDLLSNAREYARDFQPPGPAHGAQVAVVACMDARMDVYRILGLRPGDAHVIRNAGGAVTEDAIRSLAVSQRLLGSREVILLHHTDCGMTTFSEEDFRARVESETGIRPPWAVEAFADAEADVRQSLARIRANPFLPYRDRVRGFVYSVENGGLTEVMG